MLILLYKECRIQWNSLSHRARASNYLVFFNYEMLKHGLVMALNTISSHQLQHVSSILQYSP
ncbi:hypothetical protein OIU79_019011, partial [Salix purpurea]